MGDGPIRPSIRVRAHGTFASLLTMEGRIGEERGKKVERNGKVGISLMTFSIGRTRRGELANSGWGGTIRILGAREDQSAL